MSLTVNPSPLDFGNIFCGTTHTQTVSVTNNYDETVTVTPHISENLNLGQLTIEPSGWTTMESGDQQTYTIKCVVAASPTGQARASIAFNSSEVSASLNVTGTPIIADPLAVAEPDADLGDIKLGRVSSKTFTVSNSKTGAVSVDVTAAVTTPNDNLGTVTVTPSGSQTIAANGNRTFTVTCTAAGSAQNVSQDATLSFTPSIDGVDGTAVTRTLSGKPTNFVEVGGDSSGSSTYTFSEPLNVNAQDDQIFVVAVGATASKSITGTNASDFTVQTPSSITSLTHLPQALAVRFQPASAGTKTATLALTSTDANGDTTSYNIQLNGLAVASDGVGTAHEVYDPVTIASAALNSATGGYATASGTALGAANTTQRFYIEVPNPPTTFRLGDAAADKKIGGKGGIHFYAEKDESGNGGYFFTHTDQDFKVNAGGVTHFSSDGNAIFSSGATGHLLGAGGLYIMAGMGGDGISSHEHDRWDNREKSLAGQTSSAKLADAINKTFSVIDATVGMVLTGYGIKSYIKDRKGQSVKDNFRSAAKFGAWVTETLGNIGGLAGVVTNFLGLTKHALPGICMFAPNNITSATWGFHAIYGMAGVGVVSPFPTFLGLVDANIMAVDDIYLKTSLGHVDLASGNKVKLAASSDILIETLGSVSSRKTNIKETLIEIRAPISLMSPANPTFIGRSGGRVRTAATDIDLLANHSIYLGTGTPLAADGAAMDGHLISSPQQSLEFRKVDQTVKLTSKDIQLEGANVTTTQTGSVTLKVGDYQVEVKADGITVGKDGNPVLKIDDNAISVESSKGAKIVVDDKFVAQNKGGSSKVELEMNRGKLTGGKASILCNNQLVLIKGQSAKIL